MIDQSTLPSRLSCLLSLFLGCPSSPLHGVKSASLAWIFTTPESAPPMSSLCSSRARLQWWIWGGAWSPQLWFLLVPLCLSWIWTPGRENEQVWQEAEQAWVEKKTFMEWQSHILFSRKRKFSGTLTASPACPSASSLSSPISVFLSSRGI